MRSTVNQPSNVPTRKVAAGAMAGAGVALVVWIGALLGVDVPEEVAASVVVIVSTVAAWLVRNYAL